MKQINWTEAHRREAGPRTYEIAAQQIRAGEYDGDKFEELIESAQREEWWRRALDEMGLDPARIDREVRRIDRLARGALVREHGLRVDGVTYTGTIEGARSYARTIRGRVSHVTRIRKAVKP